MKKSAKRGPVKDVEVTAVAGGGHSAVGGSGDDDPGPTVPGHTGTGG